MLSVVNAIKSNYDILVVVQYIAIDIRIIICCGSSVQNLTDTFWSFQG
jgi:hypothetical protein